MYMDPTICATSWIYTIPEYYADGLDDHSVRTILDVATSGLAANPDRKFIYVEVAFFQLWWREQNETWRAETRKLVENGQLVFINAGWCMSDEATSHFVDQVDQMTIGHLWLQAQFGRYAIQPRVGWHIDPFGHTTGTAFLFAKMGFNMFQFGRSPAKVSLPTAPNGNQFLWRPLQSISDNSIQDLWTYFHNGYYGGPPYSCQEPGGCALGDMIQYATKLHNDVAPRYSKCAITEELYGSDFAIPDFPTADNVVAFFEAHPELNVTAKYSTPQLFYEDMNQCNIDWTVFQPPNNDFFPYWTGFFSSQQIFKRMARSASGVFHNARVLHALKGKDLSLNKSVEMASRLNVLWQSVSVIQHHDGVTGNCEPATYVDYRMRLNYGIDVAASVISDLLDGHSLCIERPTCANNNNTRDNSQPDCHEHGPPLCRSSLNDSLSMVVMNPLAWFRNDIVHFRIEQEWPSVSVTDANASTIPVQSDIMNGYTHIAFKASNLPPLGSAVYVVAPGTETPTLSRALEAPVLTNGVLTLEFTRHGRLRRITNEIKQLTLSVSMGVRYYTPTNQHQIGENAEDGSYDFHSIDNLAYSFPADDDQASFEFLSGPLYDEVIFFADNRSGIQIKTRLYHSSSNSANASFEVIVSVGPVDISDKLSKDVVLQFNTSIESDGEFFTDDSGLEMVHRKVGVGTFGQKLGTTPGNNFYPTTGLASIKSINTSAIQEQFAWISDRSQGCTSMRNGSLEKMIYRRLLQSDGKGMETPLNGTDVMHSKHIIIFDTPQDCTKTMRNLYWRNHHPLAVAARQTTDHIAKHLQSAPMIAPLPNSILLETLQVLSNDWDSIPAPYDIPSPHPGGNVPVPKADDTAIPDGTVLLRLHHIYSTNEGRSGVDNVPVSVDLNSIFWESDITSADGLSLSALMSLKNLTRTHWRHSQDNPNTPHLTNSTSCVIDHSNGKRLVVVNPMDICTYSIVFTQKPRHRKG